MSPLRKSVCVETRKNLADDAWAAATVPATTRAASRRRRARSGKIDIRNAGWRTLARRAVDSLVRGHRNGQRPCSADRLFRRQFPLSDGRILQRAEIAAVAIAF